MKIWFLSKSSFYLDVYFFVLVILVSLGYLISSITSLPMLGILSFCVIGGFVGWTIFEYMLHRWAFHGFMIKEHWLHHKDPEEYIGAPIYVSIGAYIVLLGLLYLFFSIPIMTAISLGFVFGYMGYLYVHYLDHHQIVYPDQQFYEIRNHHLLHHNFAGGNYGITTKIWDRLLRTNL